jgi:hypothetical protein
VCTTRAPSRHITVLHDQSRAALPCPTPHPHQAQRSQARRTVGGGMRSAWYRRFHVASLFAFHERKSAGLTRTLPPPAASSSPVPTLNTSVSRNATVCALLPVSSHTCSRTSGGQAIDHRLPPGGERERERSVATSLNEGWGAHQGV